jgi:hypothetical protein
MLASLRVENSLPVHPLQSSLADAPDTANCYVI